MTADAAIQIVLLTLQGCKLHTHDHQLPPGLATVQEVTARMFTTTLSEFVTARESSQINDTDSDNVGNRDATSDRWFHCLTEPPTYLYDATFHPFFFYAYAKWKARTNVTPGRQHGSRY